MVTQTIRGLLGDWGSRYEPWGSSIRGAWFSSWYVLSMGIDLKVHSPAQDGVLLSRWSLFCLFLPSPVDNKLETSHGYHTKRNASVKPGKWGITKTGGSSLGLRKMFSEVQDKWRHYLTVIPPTIGYMAQ